MDTDALNLFHPAVAAWFRGAFAAPSPAQRAAWPAIKAGSHTLIAAPTGSGKTLAAFLCAIDELVRGAAAGTLADATTVVYVSPLKALSNDIERNLQAPLQGIRALLPAAAGGAATEIRAGLRTGDTPASARTAMTKRPPHVVVTTPESLYLLLTSAGGRGLLATTRTVIVDEIHAILGSKRGAHLALSLERLDALTAAPVTRIGLSATQRPIATAAAFLTGMGRAEAAAGSPPPPPPACRIVDTGHRRAMEVALELPGSPLEAVMANEVWEELYQRLAELILEHRTTLIFVNTRRLAERMSHALGALLGEEQVAAHHGSLSREQRLDAEQRLKAGDLQVIVATASLELGIDVGVVDLVCQFGSPKSIMAFLQRVGRSGHHISGTPKGRLFPLTRDELVECAALLAAAQAGELDRISVPPQPLDVLAQQIVAEVSTQEWAADDLFAVCRRAYPYRELDRGQFDAVVRMLAEGFSTRARPPRRLPSPRRHRRTPARAPRRRSGRPDQRRRHSRQLRLSGARRSPGSVHRQRPRGLRRGERARRHLPARQQVVGNRQGRDRGGAGAGRRYQAAHAAVLAGGGAGPERPSCRRPSPGCGSGCSG